MNLGLSGGPAPAFSSLLRRRLSTSGPCHALKAASGPQKTQTCDERKGFSVPQILIVEDQPNLVRSVGRSLEEAGCTCLLASSLQAARREMSSTVKLIVLDPMLPDGGGVAQLPVFGLPGWPSHRRLIAEQTEMLLYGCRTVRPPCLEHSLLRISNSRSAGVIVMECQSEKHRRCTARSLRGGSRGAECVRTGAPGTNDPDTGDIYGGLDRFSRVKGVRWRKSGSDLSWVEYGYDRAGHWT